MTFPTPADGVEFPDATRRLVLGDEIGTPYDDRSIFGGYDDGTVFDADPWSATDMLAMLGRDGKAALVEQVLTMPIARLDWSFAPAKGDRGEAEFVGACFEAMGIPMQFVIAQATSAFLTRKAFFEKVFRVGAGDLAGRIVYDKIAFRPAGTCTVAREARRGAFRGFRQVPYFAVATSYRDVPPDGWLTIPAPRAWVYIHGQHRDPMRGISSMEVAYWAYQTKIKLRWLWLRMLERQVLPGAIVRGAEAADTARRLAELKAGGIAHTSDVASEIMPWGGGANADQFIAAIRFLDGEMAGSVLAGFTGLTDAAAEGRGSFALSRDASDFFLKSRQAAADELAYSINEYLVKPLVGYNYGAAARPPVFTFGRMSGADVSDVVALFSQLVTAQAPAVPGGFVRQLAEKVAEHMDLDTEALAAEFEAMAARGAETAGAGAGAGAAQVGRLAAATEAAARVVGQAGRSGGGAG